MEAFWPRHSPHFLACRQGVRAADTPHQVAVGLSGGADSLALTAALVAEGHEVTALCVDHGLQEGSAAQARRAAAQAEKLGAYARVLTVQVAEGESLEAAARVARYRALAQHAPLIAVAHTADDQAETLLLGVLRGKASGMSPRAEIEGAHILRPLLNVRRADTLGACAELGLEPWSDPQNFDQGFRRARLRHDILPQLNDIVGGDVVPALAQAAADVAADDAALTSAPLGPRPDCAELARLAEPVRRRALASWLVAQHVKVTRQGLRDIAKLCTQWHGQGAVAVAAEPGFEPKSGQRLEVTRVGGKLALLSGR
ncbi:tRNA lysidine(34) synthetase TilS [Corynebacterium flavescens]|uniref:tRNA(Ile)-lysidine synthase n=1 Tax=Corynebacterium flavescens TaxID=28028 RepID=A0A1L7CP81_CORFL|nr:tRNA lysidine(34) synthetase TilS [Corynebacterium flavescens]APT87653.1 tRNA(Ile)-lysidine synthetase [Corynebacterium flavescens]KAA8720153.1 tRNA lysidine(34) synthetase TilS [Corynebacterium flavescens]GEB96960.1 tRNA(Ile)-lysidine synthase [Corynebacterium flavescens]